MNEATYNITDNRIKLWLDDRLSAEDYKTATSLRFAWWPGRECFAATWSPEVDDFALRFVEEIKEDDTPDDVESRVGRFAKRAEREERAAEYAAERAMEATTTRRAMQASLTAVKSLDAAAYWQSRIAGAVRHAAMKDRPDVIARRIKGLEADVRKYSKNQAEAQKWIAAWNAPDKELTYDRAKAIANYCGSDDVVDDRGRRFSSVWSALDANAITPEHARELSVSFLSAREARCERWLAHLAMRLEYEKAYLDAVGGNPIDKLAGLKAGDSVVWRGRTVKVLKVNKTTVSVDLGNSWQRNGCKVDKSELQPARSSEEVQA